MKKRHPLKNKLCREIERLVNRLMPLLLILLTAMIIAEFTKWGHEHEALLGFLDSVVVAWFVIDLCFKWYHIRKLKAFVRLYWIDVIAVFPFYLAFRAFTLIREIAIAEEAQKLLHETVLVRETRLIKEVEALSKARYAARVGYIGRIVQTIARLLRLLRARWYLTYFKMKKLSN